MKKGENFNRPAKGRTTKIEPIRNDRDIQAIKKLLSKSPRNLALFNLGIHTGLGPIDLLNIRAGQVRGIEPLDELEVTESRPKTVRRVILDEACVHSIQHLIRELSEKGKKAPDADAYLFQCTGGRLSVPYLNNLVKKWCAAIELPRNFGGQTLRKTFGYQKLLKGVMSLHQLMVDLNHYTHRQTLKYLCIDREEAEGIKKRTQIKRAFPAEETNHRIVALKKENDQLKQMVEDLQNSENKYKTYFDNARDEIVYIDTEGKVLDVNEATRNVFGWTREESLGKYLWELELFRKEEVESRKEKILGTIRENLLIPISEVQVMHKNGTPIFIEVTSRYIKKNDEIHGILNIIRDVTDRKKAEQALQESEEMARALLNATTDAVMLLDSDGRILDLNSTYADTLGKPSGEIIGTFLWDYIPFDLGKNEIRQVFYQVVQSGRPIRFEKKYREIWLDNVVYPIPDIQGKITRIAIFSHDNTSRKNAEELLRKHRDNLEELVEKRTQNLEEANTALKVLLKRREEDKLELEGKMLLNVKELIMPFIEELKNGRLDDREKSLVGIIAYNLNNIISPFTQKLSSKYLNLTPTEIRITNLIQQEKTTKEIAEALRMSVRTIDNHRYHIRKKLGINNEKANLTTHILSFK